MFAVFQELLPEFREIPTEVIKPWNQTVLLQLRDLLCGLQRSLAVSLTVRFTDGLQLLGHGPQPWVLQASHAHWWFYIDQDPKEQSSVCPPAAFVSRGNSAGPELGTTGSFSPSDLSEALAVQVEPAFSCWTITATQQALSSPLTCNDQQKLFFFLALWKQIVQEKNNDDNNNINSSHWYQWSTLQGALSA